MTVGKLKMLSNLNVDRNRLAVLPSEVCTLHLVQCTFIHSKCGLSVHQHVISLLCRSKQMTNANVKCN